MLWRGGECYAVDTHVTNAPLWWFPCEPESAPAALAPAEGSPTITRRVPPVYVPGQPVLISLEIAPGALVAAFAAEELVPEGWTLSSVNEAGEFDPVNQRVKWGPFLDSAPRSLRYALTPPVSAREILTLRGQGSFDGRSQPAQGEALLAPAGWLEVDLSAGEGAFHLRLFGEPGREYLIEASTNLLDWIELGRVTASATATTFADTEAGQHAMRFYRVRPLAP
jgi:hypothetical protein